MTNRIEENIEYTTEFIKIIDFYLFNCPVDNETNRGVTFEKVGWKGKYLTKYYELIKECSTLDKNIVFCNVDEINQKKRIYENTYDKEFIVCHTGNGKTKTLFLAIRHAIAHGDFKVIKKENTKFYYLRNINAGKVKAIVNLKEETLLKWIEIFYYNPEYFTSDKQSERVKNKINKNEKR